MLLRLARVISALAAARCTFRPRVQAQVRKAQPVLPPRPVGDDDWLSRLALEPGRKPARLDSQGEQTPPIGLLVSLSRFNNDPVLFDTPRSRSRLGGCVTL